MRKILYIIVALALASVCRAQNVDGKFIQTGFTIMIEGEGMGNEATGLGGVACTVGYQFTPNLFLGGGMKTIWGGRCSHSFYRNHSNEDRKYYEDSRDNTYWIDDNGNRYVYRAYDKDGNVVYFNYPGGSYDPEVGLYVPNKYYDENGNEITEFRNNGNSYIDEDCCGFDYSGVFKAIPYICVKYNLLGDARVQPYADLRIGWDMLREEDNDKYGLDLNVMAGLRMSLNEGRQAVNISAGLSVSDLRGYSDDHVWGMEKMFMMRFGFEF
ncbi:MAG: hypothetical protein MJZ66_07735 [Bacteroidales bacterium]|nr:hypothetical protein [Bacteroidales bacterium]